jgi:ribosomal protein L24E
MYVCYLCGFTIDRIPGDAIQIGKLYKFLDGTYHWLRKKKCPRTSPRKYRRNPDREAPEVGSNEET